VAAFDDFSYGTTPGNEHLFPGDEGRAHVCINPDS
jgi:hypothetical protein